MSAALLLAWALAAPNPTPDASAAEDAFTNGDYETALEALERAYAQDPDPLFLFAEGSTLQRIGRYQDAIEAYERFLATGPERTLAQKAYDRIQECRAALEPEPEPVPAPRAEPQPEPTTPIAQPRTTQDPDGPAHWSRDPLGGVLLAGGIALGTAGGVFIGVGTRRRADAETEATEGAFRDAVSASNTLQGVGIGVAVGGGLLLTGAVLRYWKVSRVEPSAGGVAVRF